MNTRIILSIVQTGIAVISEMTWRGRGGASLLQFMKRHCFILHWGSDTTSTSHWLKWFRNFQNRFCVQRSRHSPRYHHPVLPGETFPAISLEDFWPITCLYTVKVIITKFYQVRLFQASHWRIFDQLQVQAQSSLSSPSSNRWDSFSHLIGGF